MNSPIASTPRRREIWDVVLTIIFIVASFGGLATSGVFDFLIMAFTDYCPAVCQANLSTGLAVIMTIWIGSAVLCIAAAVVSIMLLVRRRRAFWLPLAATVVVALGAVAGFWSYSAIIS